MGQNVLLLIDITKVLIYKIILQTSYLKTQQTFWWKGNKVTIQLGKCMYHLYERDDNVILRGGGWRLAIWCGYIFPTYAKRLSYKPESQTTRLYIATFAFRCFSYFFPWSSVIFYFIFYVSCRCYFKPRWHFPNQ